MGYAAAGACFPTQQSALDNWCAHVEPGDSAMSCNVCDATNGTCTVTYLPSYSSQPLTTVLPVYTPACEVPTPVNDALAYTGAIILMWVAVWAAKSLYNFFRVPHADNH